MNGSVMTIFAHQDDETFSAGGTLAKYTQSHAVSVTKDSKRVKEFHQACSLLNTEAIQLDYENITPVNQKEIQTSLIQLIQEKQPTQVITHIDFDYHHEHRLLRAIVEEAVEWSSHTTTRGTNAHQVTGFWAAETTVLIPKPEIFIDITKTNKQRLDAIKTYESQSHKGGDQFYSNFHNTRTKLRGYQVAVDHAEAFLSIPFLRTGSFKPIKVLEFLP